MKLIIVRPLSSLKTNIFPVKVALKSRHLLNFFFLVLTIIKRVEITRQNSCEKKTTRYRLNLEVEEYKKITNVLNLFLNYII